MLTVLYGMVQRGLNAAKETKAKGRKSQTQTSMEQCSKRWRPRDWLIHRNGAKEAAAGKNAAMPRVSSGCAALS